MTNQVQILNQIQSMYKSGKIDLASFRNAVMRVEFMYLQNKSTAQNGVSEKIAELKQIAKNLK